MTFVSEKVTQTVRIDDIEPRLGVLGTSQGQGWRSVKLSVLRGRF
jgi:hypothetical protein